MSFSCFLSVKSEDKGIINTLGDIIAGGGNVEKAFLIFLIIEAGDKSLKSKRTIVFLV